MPNNRLRARRLGRCKKAGFDHVPFDDVADRSDQRADVPAVAPLAAPPINHLFPPCCTDQLMGRSDA
jgi:hypothetical protein